ncbi:hypothetical protein FB451DRAFT_1040667 [Mycena latifolia]|nr:hypothetical protein FB451DRAFT_1040667 [Mycena latifolia]
MQLPASSVNPPQGAPSSRAETPASATKNVFQPTFIQSVANGLDEFDVGLFRGDGDINFERDFGQWFNPDDVGKYIDSHSFACDLPDSRTLQVGIHLLLHPPTRLAETGT